MRAHRRRQTSTNTGAHAAAQVYMHMRIHADTHTPTLHNTNTQGERMEIGKWGDDDGNRKIRA